jgi:class 3 adenylate cyclase
MAVRRHIPIRIYVGALFTILAIVVGVATASLFLNRMRSALAATSAQLFDRTTTIVTSDVAAARAQITLSLHFAARSPLARAAAGSDRSTAVDVLGDILDQNPWVEAAYAGYPQGDFVLLRRRPAGRTVLGDLPPAVSFVLQTVERDGRTVHGGFVFYDAGMRALARRTDPAYRFDPRVRPWYVGARAGRVTLTAPYLFYTTRQSGVTMSLRTPAGSVVAADIALASVSEEFATLRTTPSSAAAIVEPNGRVIAFSDPPAFGRAAGAAAGLPTLGQLRAPVLAAAIAAAAGTGEVDGTLRDANGRTWVYRVRPVLPEADGTSRLLALATPEDELYAAADRARNEAIAIAIGMLLIWIPCSLYFARLISGPLDALRADALALRNGDFGDRVPPSSIISEIDEFAGTFESMRRHIRARDEATTRFVPRAFLKQLGLTDITALHLGDHVERHMTILFSDIRSFTALSESMSPQQTFNFVNSYLTRVGPIIRDHGGFIDKYIGDAIMGLFSDEPRFAIDAAIAMQRRVVVYNEERARAGYAPIAIGIGLHTGELMLGTIGESQRFETTVIADAVNVASRLESLTKTFGSLVLASGQVLDAVDASAYQVRRLGDVQVVGTTRPIALYEICDADPAATLAHKVRTERQFEAGRLAYAAGDFAAAGRLFDEVLADDANDRAARYFRNRITTFETAAVAAAWDGIERMEMK